MTKRHIFHHLTVVLTALMTCLFLLSPSYEASFIHLRACAVTKLSEMIYMLSQWIPMSFPRRMTLETELSVQKLKR